MFSGDKYFDVLFAGGGATACVVAGRLAEIDPSLKILIVESGQHTNECKERIQPGRSVRNLTSNPEIFSYYHATPSISLMEREIIVQTGKGLGGGSSVNFMTYTRAAASDYDDWENAYGNKGWSSRHLIPLLIKAETYQSGGSHNSTNGTYGPIKISRSKMSNEIAEQFLTVAGLYDKQRTFTNDINDFTTCNSYGAWDRYIDIDSGRRSDTAHGYIYSLCGKKNEVTIITNAKVIRIIFEGNHASGVEYVQNTESGVASVSVARASKMVVVSAGAFGSPAILERSGIGAQHILEKNGITVVANLPGVGENYMDHNLIFSPYLVDDNVVTMDPIYHGKEEELKPYEDEWTRTGGGLMGQNGLDAMGKIRPTKKELEDFGVHFVNRWNSHFRDAPDKPLLLMAPSSAYAGPHRQVPNKKCFTMGHHSVYPISTGHVHITSGIDPQGELDFRSGFLDDPLDIEVLRWAYKKSRELARRMPCYRGEYILGHPEFPDGSQAACEEGRGAVSIDAPDISYTADDNDAIDKFIRKTVQTTWHSMGTCSMKARNQNGVVDNRLNVYGVTGLKVADLSIIPSNVGGPTYNTAIAIGEKAALLIAEDLASR